ncbi:MAG TPA: sulfotransferase [Cytophagaceae bacterium]|jgi:hypothetical protein|nr:sulfotransferase [Cytophagaceae bacterium]
MKCLIIIGMHRSGTSLTSAILQKAGLFIGDELMGAGNGNTKGHFESTDFHNLHTKALQHSSLNVDGWDLQTIDQLPAELDKEATQLIEKNQQLQWGWKNPRTTLFMNYWCQKIPDAYYLFVYRDPWDVADSLFRRGSDRKVRKNPSFAFKAWDFYNREVMRMFQKNQKNSILIHIDDFVKNIPRVIGEINERFGFHLSTQGTENIFDQSIYNASDLEKIKLRAWKTRNHFPEVIDTLNELRTLSKITKYNQEKFDGRYRMPDTR